MESSRVNPNERRTQAIAHKKYFTSKKQPNIFFQTLDAWDWQCTLDMDRYIRQVE